MNRKSKALNTLPRMVENGPPVLLLGKLLGFWIPRVRWQRRSGYDRF